MAVTIRKFPDERIIIMDFTEPFVGHEDLPLANKATAEFMDAVGEPVYRIENVLNMDLDFSKMVDGLGSATKNERGSMADPDVHGVFVGQGKIPAMTADAFSQKNYGGKETPFFTTVEAALAFIRSGV